MSGHIVSKRIYFTIFAALMGLLALTYVAAHTNLGALNIYVAMAIAVVKGGLVVTYFMHLKYSYKLVWVVALGGFLWLAILIVGTGTDYISREWIPVIGVFK